MKRTHRTKLAAAVFSFVCLGCPEAEPDLGPLSNLLEAQRFDEAEALLDRQLRVHPEDVAARILSAQVALAKPSPDPARALNVLEPVDTKEPATLAVVWLNRGKADSNLHDYEQAEKAWRIALQLNPKIPEAGWALLGLYYVQGRRREARALALSLYEREPDPRDRVQLLLELVRQDAQPLEPASVAENLELGVKLHPSDLKTTIGLAQNLIKSSDAERGLALLKTALNQSSKHPDALEGMLKGLDSAGRYPELAETLAAMPPTLRVVPRFARFVGRDAQEKRDWKTASDAYLKAWNRDPSDPELTYRLSRSLRLAGVEEEAALYETKAKAMESARETILSLYEEANAKIGRDLKVTLDHLDVYRRLAENCEARGLREQASRWQALILKERTP